MSKAFIYHQHKKIYFEIPSQWNVLTFAKFDEYPIQRDVRELTKKTLIAPIHAKTLKDSLYPSDKVAIIVEDLTRASPKRLILETLVEELEAVDAEAEEMELDEAEVRNQMLQQQLSGNGKQPPDEAGEVEPV